MMVLLLMCKLNEEKKMEKGDIVAVVNMAGEYVGKIKEIGISLIVLENPRMVINNQEGMGFARGV